MIDVVEEVEPGNAKGYKNLTNNEWYLYIFWFAEYTGATQAMAQMLTVAITTLDGGVTIPGTPL